MDKITKTSKVKDWYTSPLAFKSDELGKKLNPTVTFSDLMKCMRKGENVYGLLGVGDSVIRERVFVILADLYADSDYGEIYNLWLYGADNVSIRESCVGVNKKGKVRIG